MIFVITHGVFVFLIYDYLSISYETAFKIKKPLQRGMCPFSEWWRPMGVMQICLQWFSNDPMVPILQHFEPHHKTTQQHFVLQLGTTRVMIIVFSKGNIFCHGCQSWYFGQKNQKWKENCPSWLFITLLLLICEAGLKLTVPFKKVTLKTISYHAFQSLIFVNRLDSFFRLIVPPIEDK